MTIDLTQARARPRWGAVALLAMGQTIAWAGLYYVFAALLLTWEQSLGWAKTELTLGLTAAVLVAAACAPLVGRLIDAGKGRWVLGLGTLGGAAALGLLSTAENSLAFVAIWMVIGVAQSASLYEACFAFVTRVTGDMARAAITRITLFAGLASAIAFPAGAVLADALGWRGAVLVFAAVVAAVGAPLQFFGATLLQRYAATPPTKLRRTEERAAVRAARLRPEFWLIAIAFPMMALNHGIMLNHFIPLLVERGIAEAMAVTAASVIGPMQVIGRLAMARLENRLGALSISMLAFGGVSCAALLLLAAGAAPLLVFAFAAMQGAAYGVTSILKPVVTAESLGRAAFGAIAGWLALPYLAGYAVAPHLGAILRETGNYDLVILAAASMGVVGLVCILALWWFRRSRSGSTGS